MRCYHNRRTFIKTSSVGTIGMGITATSLMNTDSAFGAFGKSKVAVVNNDKAISNRNLCDRDQARLMVDRALLSITGKKNPNEAWSSLGVTKHDVVGIKVNCNTWTFLLHTHPGLVYALCDSLSGIVKPNNIIIYERNSSELSRSGYIVNTGASGVRCYGNDEGGGIHPGEELTRIVTDTCTKIINMPSLKTVDGGFAASLFIKNHIGSLPGSHMTRCHGNEDFCSQVCARPSIKNKTILAVCDGLRGTYKRGAPWYCGSIIMSADQVAAEYAAIGVINEKRAQEKIRAIKVQRYVRNAETKYGLGTCNPDKIYIKSITM